MGFMNEEEQELYYLCVQDKKDSQKLQEVSAKDYDKDGFGYGFPTHTQPKPQYTNSFPDFSFNITLKYVGGVKLPDMPWQQIW